MRVRLRYGLLFAAALAVYVAACEEYSTEALVTVEIRQATAWPDTLDLAEIADLTVEIVDPQGRAITGIDVDWQTSDSAVLELSSLASAEAGTSRDSLDSGLTTVVTSHSAGSAEVIARIDRPDFEPTELRVPLTVVREGWPDFVTVTAVDTVEVAVGHLEEESAADLDVEWASSDPATLKVQPLEADPLRATVTGHASGTAEIVVAVDGARLAPMGFRIPMIVSGMEVVASTPWPESINLTNVVTVEVEIRDASGAPLTDVELVWRSSNEVALTVTALDEYRAQVTGVSRGGAEVIATAGGPGFQTAEYRGWISVQQRWKSVDAGYQHTCALTNDGTAYCWGRNTDGELGAGHYDHRSRPERVATFLKLDEIQAGGLPYYDNLWEQAHTCGRLGGGVFCWGGFHNDQLGDGQGPCTPDQTPHECAQPIPVEIDVTCTTCGSSPQVESIAVGGSHSCAGILSDYPGEVSCWGSIGSGNQGWTPSAGGAHVCTYSSLVGTLCMGDNRAGQLGDGTTNDAASSVQVRDASTNPLWSRPVAGFQHSCAVVNSRAWCWGSNSRGQLGTTAPAGGCGGNPCSVYAVPVQQLNVNVSAITLGLEHTCALASGDVYCWGSNTQGQLGNTNAASSSVVPVLVEGGHTFVGVSAGAEYTCGVTAEGSLYCWGDNLRGQLGNGTTADSRTPVRVSEPQG
jgi:alpha-tubulin suppressor-like RCC1 family protein